MPERQPLSLRSFKRIKCPVSKNTVSDYIHAATATTVFALIFCLPRTVLCLESTDISNIRSHKTGTVIYNHQDIKNITNIPKAQKARSNPKEHQAQHQKQNPVSNNKLIRDFVLYNYDHIADNIINGKGLHLRTLYHLLGIDEDKKDNCRRDFLKILIEKKRIPDFATSISKYGERG